MYFIPGASVDRSPARPPTSADLRRALLGVNVVHMTGETETSLTSGVHETDIDDPKAYLPLALHREKWVRREPYAMYEETTPVIPIRKIPFWGGTAKTGGSIIRFFL
jgi:hypothetical protein